MPNAMYYVCAIFCFLLHGLPPLKAHSGTPERRSDATTSRGIANSSTTQTIKIDGVVEEGSGSSPDSYKIRNIRAACVNLDNSSFTDIAIAAQSSQTVCNPDETVYATLKAYYGSIPALTLSAVVLLVVSIYVHTLSLFFHHLVYRIMSLTSYFLYFVSIILFMSISASHATDMSGPIIKTTGAFGIMLMIYYLGTVLLSLVLAVRARSLKSFSLGTTAIIVPVGGSCTGAFAGTSATGYSSFVLESSKRPGEGWDLHAMRQSAFSPTRPLPGKVRVYTFFKTCELKLIAVVDGQGGKTGCYGSRTPSEVQKISSKQARNLAKEERRLNITDTQDVLWSDSEDDVAILVKK